MRVEQIAYAAASNRLPQYNCKYMYLPVDKYPQWLDRNAIELFPRGHDKEDFKRLRETVEWIQDLCNAGNNRRGCVT